MPEYLYEPDLPTDEPAKPDLMDVITALEARIVALEQAIQPAALHQALGRHTTREQQRTVTQMITPPGEQL